MAGGNDFFLEFGSNAREFATGLESDAQRATQAIEQMIAAAKRGNESLSKLPAGRNAGAAPPRPPAPPPRPAGGQDLVSQSLVNIERRLNRMGENFAASIATAAETLRDVLKDAGAVARKAPRAPGTNATAVSEAEVPARDKGGRTTFDRNQRSLTGALESLQTKMNDTTLSARAARDEAHLLNNQLDYMAAKFANLQVVIDRIPDVAHAQIAPGATVTGAAGGEAAVVAAGRPLTGRQRVQQQANDRLMTAITAEAEAVTKTTDAEKQKQAITEKLDAALQAELTELDKRRNQVSGRGKTGARGGGTAQQRTDVLRRLDLEEQGIRQGYGAAREALLSDPTGHATHSQAGMGRWDQIAQGLLNQVGLPESMALAEKNRRLGGTEGGPARHGLTTTAAGQIPFTLNRAIGALTPEQIEGLPKAGSDVNQWRAQMGAAARQQIQMMLSANPEMSRSMFPKDEFIRGNLSAVDRAGVSEFERRSGAGELMTGLDSRRYFGARARLRESEISGEQIKSSKISTASALEFLTGQDRTGQGFTSNRVGAPRGILDPRIVDILQNRAAPPKSATKEELGTLRQEFNRFAGGFNRDLKDNNLPELEAKINRLLTAAQRVLPDAQTSFRGFAENRGAGNAEAVQATEQLTAAKKEQTESAKAATQANLTEVEATAGVVEATKAKRRTRAASDKADATANASKTTEATTAYDSARSTLAKLQRQQRKNPEDASLGGAIAAAEQDVQRSLAAVTAERAARKAGSDLTTIYRGEGAGAFSAGAATKASPQGRFFTQDIEQARGFAGPGGRVLSTQVGPEVLNRARQRATDANVLEGLIVPKSVARGAQPLDAVERAAERGVDAALNTSRAGGGGRGGGRRPRAAAAAAGDNEPSQTAGQLGLFSEETRNALARARVALKTLTSEAERSAAIQEAGGAFRFDPAWNQLPNKGVKKATFRDALGLPATPETNRMVTDLFRENDRERAGLLESNPAFNDQFKASRTRTAAAGGTGLSGADAIAEVQARLVQMLERVRAANPAATEAEINGVVTAFSRLEAASGRLHNVLESDTSTMEQLNRAVAQASSADAGLNRAINVATHGRGIPGAGGAGGAGAGGAGGIGGIGGGGGGGPVGGPGTPGGLPNSLQGALFGSRGFGSGLLSHAGRAIENTISYSLTFQGLEKLHELVQTGIEAQESFVRLQATFDALGESTKGLKENLIGISGATAQPIQEITTAAADLAGTLKNAADVQFGATIAGQLANVSQGALTATEAATGLRDVAAAYGQEWAKNNISVKQGLQQTGDEIAHISEITGVSVKDVLDSTTQLAQESKHFGLSQQQTSVLGAEITRNTGETGEASAEQLSRIFSTLNSGKVQQALIKAGVATRAQFQGQDGGLSAALGELIAKFQHLTPAAQQSIFALVGSGRQARAFTGLMNDSARITDLFNQKQASTGTLADLNRRYLNTLGGALQKLSEDFQNLGARLQQLGAFNAFGALIKGLDLALTTISNFLGFLNRLADSNPITKFAKEGAAGILTLLVAMKALQALWGATVGRLGGRGAAGASAAALGPEGAAGARRGIFSPLGTVTRPFVPPPFIGPLEEGQVRRSPFSPFRLGQTVLGAPFQALGRGTSAVGGRLASLGEDEATRIQRISRTVGTGLQTAGGGLSNFATRIQTFATSTRVGAAAMGALNVGFTAALIALPFVIEAISKLNDQYKKSSDILNQALGNTPGGNNPNAVGSDRVTEGQKLAQQAGKPSVGGTILNTLGGVGSIFRGGTFSDIFNSDASGNRSGGVTSGKYDQTSGREMTKAFGELRGAKNSQELAKATKDINDWYKKNAADLVKSAGDKAAQISAQQDITQTLQSLQQAAANRQQTLDGISKIDQLNETQIENIQAYVQQTASLNKGTLKVTGFLTQFDASKLNLDPGSDAAKQAAAAGNSNLSDTQRRQAQIALLSQSLKSGQERLKALSAGQSPDALATDPQFQALNQSLDQQAAQYQQLVQTQLTTPPQVLQNASGLAEQQGNYTTAVADLQQANQLWQSYANTLAHDDPAYIQALKTINDNRQKIAELQGDPQVLQLQLAAARTNDPVMKAQDNLKAAQIQAWNANVVAAQQQADTLKQAQADQKTAQANFNKATANMKALSGEGDGLVQANASATVSAAAAKLASANAALTAAQHPSDTPAQQQANIAAAAANLQAQDAQEQERQAAAQAQIATYRNQQANYNQQGLELQKQLLVYTQGDLADSTKAAQIFSQMVQLNQQIGDLTEQTNQSQMNLTATRQEASGNIVAAAQTRAHAAQQHYEYYKQIFGADDSRTLDAQAQAITAARSAFDTSLNQQLSVLDFQQQTYKITSTQEIAALQQILKNKNLTYEEQRNIILKIKGLQEQIRQALTEGGMNIPSDIKLPSAYQVRRSLSAVAGTGTTQAVVTNNTNSNSGNVTINNQGLSQAQMAQITQAVVAAVSTTTSTQVRANTATPSIVNRGG